MLFSCIVLPAPGAQASYPPEGVCGYVRDRTTNRPIADVLVYIDGSYEQGFTNGNGAYYIVKQAYGTYHLIVQRDGFNATDGYASITRNTVDGIAVANFVMGRVSNAFSGYVMDMNGVGIGGATVIFPGPSYVTADAAGFYHYHSLSMSNQDLIAYKPSSSYWYHTVPGVSYQGGTYKTQDFYLTSDTYAWGTVLAVFCTRNANSNIKVRLYWEASHSQTITYHSYAAGFGSDVTTTRSTGDASDRYNVTGYAFQQKLQMSGYSRGTTLGSYTVQDVYVKTVIDEVRCADLTSDGLWKQNVTGGTIWVPVKQGDGTPGHYTKYSVDSGSNAHTIGLDVSISLPIGKFVSASVTIQVTRTNAEGTAKNVGVEFWNYNGADKQFEWYMDEGNDDGLTLHMWQV